MTDHTPTIYASPELDDLILEKLESSDPLQENLVADPSVVTHFDQVSENSNV